MRLPPELSNPAGGRLLLAGAVQRDSCPADSVVGSVQVSAKAYILVVPIDLTNNGTVYNLTPTGDEPCPGRDRRGGAGRLSKIFLRRRSLCGPDQTDTGSSRPSPTSRASRQDPHPDHEDRAHLQRHGEQGAVHADAPHVPPARRSAARTRGTRRPLSPRKTTVTPEGCDSLPFSGSAEGSMGAPA